MPIGYFIETDGSKQYGRDCVIDDAGQVTLGTKRILLTEADYPVKSGTCPMCGTSMDKKKPATESAIDTELEGEFIRLLESKIGSDGVVPIKLIQPGWGSSGYYPRDVLERDGPKVFRKGTKMYLDHPTPAEESARPEGSVKNLAAILATDARFIEHGKHGPGLYADARVGQDFRGFIEDFGSQIGVSVRGTAAAKKGTAEGREGYLIERLASAKSVDFVTEAGAGGKILQMYESARKIANGEQHQEEKHDARAGK